MTPITEDSNDEHIEQSTFQRESYHKVKRSMTKDELKIENQFLKNQVYQLHTALQTKIKDNYMTFQQNEKGGGH